VLWGRAILGGTNSYLGSLVHGVGGRLYKVIIMTRLEIGTKGGGNSLQNKAHTVNFLEGRHSLTHLTYQFPLT